MKFLALTCLFLLAGCASMASVDALDREVEALQSPEMEAAIQAARPGVPR